VGPLEHDPTGEEEVGILGLLKFFVIVLVCVALAGKFFTGSYTWEYKGKWLQLKTYWPVSYESISVPLALNNVSFFVFTQQNQRLFSEGYLAQFNGQDGRPLYLAVR
jgi:hypothetical protein